MKPQRRELVAKAIVPDYALGPQTASLGLAPFIGTTLPTPFASSMFIGQHGSWNRRPHSGYKVIFVPFTQSKPSGPSIDVLTGFLSEEGNAFGRPVGVAVDKKGALLVADDVGNVIWRGSRQQAQQRLGVRHSGVCRWSHAHADVRRHADRWHREAVPAEVQEISGASESDFRVTSGPRRLAIDADRTILAMARTAVLDLT